MGYPNKAALSLAGCALALSPQTKPWGHPAQDPPTRNCENRPFCCLGLAPRMVVANLISQVVFGLLAMAIALPSMQEWGALLDASQG
jgi:hypothetical protein